MTVTLFVFALLFLLCAVLAIIAIVLDTDDGIVLFGVLSLFIGCTLSVLAIVQFAQGAG